MNIKDFNAENAEKLKVNNKKIIHILHINLFSIHWILDERQYLSDCMKI